MGNKSSSLVDCVQDGDTQRLKQQLAARVADVEDGDLSDAELHGELEDAVHTAVSMEITTPHQYQQLQIALELLLHVAPTALQTSECNEAQWSALHRACVTSNLAFVAFLFHRYTPYMSTDRDAFGLLPLDLVPPELGFIGAATATATAAATARPRGAIQALPSTERERIELALAVLRQRKRDVQNHAVRSYLPRDVGNQATTDTEHTEDGRDREPYFIAFEPSRGVLSHEVAGVVHQLDLPLRVRYHLPRTDAFVFGYFQLIWRGDDEPRSEEPHYEHHVLLRDSVDLDHAAPRSEDLASNQHEQRRLHDTDTKNKDRAASPPSTLTGSVAIDVRHLADDVVCHVLFVASDRQLMKREIVLSTEGVRLVRVDALNADRSGGQEMYYEAPPCEDDADSDGDGDMDGFVFHVGGEAFKHPSEELAGHAFETVEEFEAFVKQLRVAKQVASLSVDQEGEKDTVVRRPSVLSNQEQEAEAEDEDDDELVLVEASKERATTSMKDPEQPSDGSDAHADDNQDDA